ncbi:MAG TPA: hypothetical protein PLG34_02445 [Spirochaetota bacterium]|jgi:hypothetical protein|nr:MAG: hypothetical protein BWX91_00977 [Spirochaetes bacterium ADurb.Bin133]HNZ27650.1 hypothetical protein [Spirochaetota bacterium]HPY86825.1 hypothetical protein [Spirochaetota bacterium]HQB62685.1 hypothetical protein [Spirochaetota bacterium]
MYKILGFVLALFALSISNVSCASKTILMKNKTNIYYRVFLYYFPLSKKSTPFFILNKSDFSIEIEINNKDVYKEPSDPSIFEDDIIFRIDNIPYDWVGKGEFPVTLRTNKKIISRMAEFKISSIDGLLKLKGDIKDIKIIDITDNDYFKNRANWEEPFYFDFKIYMK